MLFTYSQIRSNPTLLDPYKSRDKVSMKCMGCEVEYFKTKNRIQDKISLSMNDNYCSLVCFNVKNKAAITHINCENCNKELEKIICKMYKSKHHFCSKNCAATFNNKNKTHGTRRSKLEVWLEERLSELYPSLQVIYNGKETIGSELDIYILSLHLAFELNGIFHYEPIYGQGKLDQIEKNDQNKFHLCKDAGISLCIINVSTMKNFKPLKAQKFLDIITKIIDETGAPVNL